MRWRKPAQAAPSAPGFRQRLQDRPARHAGAPSHSTDRRLHRRTRRRAVHLSLCHLHQISGKMRPEDILLPTPAGVCCKIGGFHIDPTRPVDKAVITHGHSDHARAGHGAVLATQETLDLMRLRYGDNFAGATQAIGYGETVTLSGVKVTFHPAGHVLGSAQVAVELDGRRVVASGAYT